MRVLRATLYQPTQAPTTVVLRDCDLAVPIEEAVAAAQEGQEHASWISTEIFTVPEGTSIVGATLMAQQRLEQVAQREANMALAFYWYTATLARVKSQGVVTATLPAPLCAEDLLLVAQAIARAPGYEQQTVIQIAEDNRRVVLSRGESRIE